MTDMHAASRGPLEVWDVTDVARYLKLTAGELDRVIATHPNFPAPISLAPTLGDRWWAPAIVAWFATLAGWNVAAATSGPTPMRHPVRPVPSPARPKAGSRG